MRNVQERTCFTRDSYKAMDYSDLCSYEYYHATHHVSKEQYHAKVAIGLLKLSALGNVTDGKSKDCPPRSGTCRPSSRLHYELADIHTDFTSPSTA